MNKLILKYSIRQDDIKDFAKSESQNKHNGNTDDLTSKIKYQNFSGAHWRAQLVEGWMIWPNFISQYIS